MTRSPSTTCGSAPFYLGVTEVTRGQFRRFVDETGYKTEAEKDGKGGYGWNEEKKTFEQDPEVHLAQPRIRADRRAPGGERELERRGGVLRVAEPERGPDLPAADRGGVGVRLPGRDHDEVLQWRRSGVAGHGRERG